MKATLEYNLPDDRDYFIIASNSEETYASLCDLDNQLRTWLKHGGHKFNTPEAAMEWVRECLAAIKEPMER